MKSSGRLEKKRKKEKGSSHKLMGLLKKVNGSSQNM